ncbi:MAG TPA: helix-turn-helix transcriptional regulator [Solirubrobacteraceae bacterium]|nr:helix-turn-helix transcriptional regulator [Solirubrobacteraceae bacterium]
MVATGKSNRQIAAELFMSVRTVETHLTKIYRQMGVGSRAQLAAHIAGRASTDTNKAAVTDATPTS